MLLTLVLVWALLKGVGLCRIALLIGTVLAPVVVGLFFGWHWWRNRPEVPTRSVLFCDAVAGELRSGAPLRMALAGAAASVDAHALEAFCHSDTPIDAVAAGLRAEFPDVGRELSGVVGRVSLLGAPSADVFEEISGLALAQVELAQELRSASAPARATAFVLLIAPLSALAVVGARGEVGGYLQSATQRGAVMIGLLMAVSGLAVGGWMLRRAR